MRKAVPLGTGSRATSRSYIQFMIYSSNDVQTKQSPAQWAPLLNPITHSNVPVNPSAVFTAIVIIPYTDFVVI